MQIKVEARPPVPDAWKLLKRYEKKAALAMFREDHIRKQNRIQYQNNLNAVENALHTRLTPEFRLKAEQERIRLKSLLN